MYDDQNTGLIAHAKQNEPVFVKPTIIIELSCEFVVKDGSGFLKGNPVLP